MPREDPLTPLLLSELMELREMGCGPAQHEFQMAGGGFTTAVSIFCTKCGDIRPLRVPATDKEPES